MFTPYTKQLPCQKCKFSDFSKIFFVACMTFCQKTCQNCHPQGFFSDTNALLRCTKPFSRGHNSDKYVRATGHTRPPTARITSQTDIRERSTAKTRPHPPLICGSAKRLKIISNIVQRRLLMKKFRLLIIFTTIGPGFGNTETVHFLTGMQ